MTVEIVPVAGLPEVEPDADLGAVVAEALEPIQVRAGDVVVVTQKIVSKAEGRVVRERDGDRSTWIERETRRIVARRGDLVIAETRHGFVCANAGVDTSNVAEGWLTLLPEDPDASAEGLRSAIAARLGVEVGVVVTDTFGRPWREGLVNVAIGCAGLPALLDLRGSTDHHGRELEATVVALADEIAAASGLAMGKASRIPVAVVRGVVVEGPPGRARDLVRTPEGDLFREAPLWAAASREPAVAFEPGDVRREAIREAVLAAAATSAPHGSRPWTFVAVDSPAALGRLRSALAERKGDDLRSDGRDDEDIAARVGEAQGTLALASAVIVPFLSMRDARDHADPGRTQAEREHFLLAAGAAIERLMAALHAQGLGSAWNAAPLFAQRETRDVLGVEDGWIALGAVAVGRMRTGAASPRPPSDLSALLRYM